MFQSNITAFGAIYNSPKLETTQISSARWVDGQIVVHPYDGILLSNRKEQTTVYSNMNGSQKCYTEGKKNRYKRVHAAWFNLYEILEKAELIRNDRGQISGCLGLRWEIASKGAQRNFLGDGNVLYHDCGDGYNGVYIFQNSSKCTLKMGAFYCTWIYLSKVGLKTRAENSINNKNLAQEYLFGSWKVSVIWEEAHQTVSFGYSQGVGIGKRDERDVFCFVLFTLFPSYK